MSDRQTLKAKFDKNRKAIEGMLKQYKYKQQLKHCENMEILSSCLESVLDVDDLSDFTKYLCDEDHLPIEINFKMLRHEKLSQLFEDWLVPRENTFSVLERMHTANFRNILFKAIFLDEKATIDQYFETISPEKRLKGFDLYQLITNLLSPYFLYEYDTDTTIFFDKINSFETFIEIVDNFLLSGRNFLVTKSRQSRGDKFIYRQEFQLLIEHWQLMNHQLTLLEAPRQNMEDYGVQTIINNQVSVEVQTNKENQAGILTFISNMLHELNIRIQKQDNPTILKSLNNMLESIRKEKVTIAQIEASRMYRRYNQAYSFDNGIDESDEPVNRRYTPVSTRHTTPRDKSPARGDADTESYLKKIFSHLCKKSSSEYINSSELQIFFYHLGLVKLHQTYLVQNLSKNGFIEYSEQICYLEFKSILKQILKESNQIRSIHLKKYIEQHVEEEQGRSYRSGRKSSTHVRQDPQFYGLFEKGADNRILDKSFPHTDFYNI